MPENSSATIYPSLRNVMRPFFVMYFIYFLIVAFIVPLDVLRDKTLEIFLSGMGISLMLPILILTCRVKFSKGRLRFFQLFLPLRIVRLENIKTIYYATVFDRTRYCAIVVEECGRRPYSYTARIFEEAEVNRLILKVHSAAHLKGEPQLIRMNEGVFFSKKTIENGKRFRRRFWTVIFAISAPAVARIVWAFLQ